MSTVLVTGGTGTLGCRLVPLLRDAGHVVRVLSRRDDGGTHVGDLTTGAGLAAALDGVEVVVHAASDSRRMGRTDLLQTDNLLGVAQHVEHLVYPSIVGIDEIPFGYYRNKLACERRITAAAVPHTVVRITQFHELVDKVLHAAHRLPVVPLPLDFRFQSVAASDVARHLTELVAAGPAGRAEDFGGPEVLTLDQMTLTWQARRSRPRTLLRLPVPGRVGDAFRRGLNTTPAHADGTQTWEQFVQAG